MSTYLTHLRRRYAEFRMAHEDTQPLDSARYVAVSTGRLEPYLRALAWEDVWVPDSRPRTQSTDGLCFAQVWATPARAKVAHPASQITGTRAVACLEDGVGLVVDPGLETELTVEPHHRDTIARLSRGEALAEAFTAIGAEELAATSTYTDPTAEVEELDLADSSERAAIGALDSLTLLRVEVCLLGSADPLRAWRVYFVQGPDMTFPLLPDSAHKAVADALGPTRVLVDPARPDWRRDLLWDMRVHAIPLRVGQAD